jgi:hypothetical protein
MILKIIGDLAPALLAIFALVCSFIGGLKGLAFFEVYFLGMAILFIAVRLPNSEENMIASTVEGQKNIPAYVIPFAYPVLFYAIGWGIALFN